MSASRSIAVVIGGGTIRPPGRAFDGVVVADSGLDVALAAGLVPTMLVGDLDSISEAGLQWAAEHGVPIERHPADKDDTDVALALRWARSLAPTDSPVDVHVLGADATSRLDHLIGTVVCLGDPAMAACRSITAHLGATRVHVLHPGWSIELDLAAGAVFSLLALHGCCAGVGVDGARWPLVEARLSPGSSLGISNESLGPPVSVSVATGVLTIIVPEVAA